MAPSIPRLVSLRGYYKEEREKKRHKELLETNLAILKELEVFNAHERVADAQSRALASGTEIPKCPVCDVLIEGRADKVYCGNACRATSYRERRRKTRHG